MMKVLEMESIFATPAYCREDLASLLRSVQVQEKEKLNLVCYPLCHWLINILFGNLGIFLIYSIFNTRDLSCELMPWSVI